MPEWETPLRLRYPFEGVRPHLLDEDRLRRLLAGLRLNRDRLSIAEAAPVDAFPGTAMVITGANFSPRRADNLVTVGGLPALVVEASQQRLFVLTDPACRSGDITVRVGGRSATAAHQFLARPWPAPGADEPAPPYSCTGRGLPGSLPGGRPVPGGVPQPGDASAAGTIPPTGTAQVLVVLTYPTDDVPSDPAQLKADVAGTFANVTTYYDQVSYGQLSVQVDVTDAIPLLDDTAYYWRANSAIGYPNIDEEVLPQLTAEAAQGAVDQGFDLDDYSVMAVLVYMPSNEVRAWGGWTQQDFTYNDGAGTTISLTAASDVSMIVARHDADWGRAAHEFGHNLVDGGLVLGEDIYASDLVDGDQATAENFDLMGNHDSHPLFSGFFLAQLGYYSEDHIAGLDWDRNPRSEEFLIVAHGAAAETDSDRYHLVRIRVSPGLEYFVEVRQRPPAGSPQVYDGNIALAAGTTRTGGVIVTKAITDVVNNNQQTRLITLLHEPAVLLTGDVATDPLRDLTVTVLDDQVSTDPLVCKVRVEWAQQIMDTPGGDFDLWITPWGQGYESPDIWIDRKPYGSYDFTDGAGNPTGNGDEPRVLEINRFTGKVHNTGEAAEDVRVTFYSVTPPGVGDNGTWTPLRTREVSIGADSDRTVFVRWIPTVDEHTCLKLIAEPQQGEISVGNNSAQENVFTFQPAGGSVPEPVAMTMAVRNPLDREALVHLRVNGVPAGYRVYLPHRWVRLPARGEMHVDLIVVPLADLAELRGVIEDVGKRGKDWTVDPAPRIRVSGQVARGYTEPLNGGSVAGSWFLSIGGLAARVEPKRLADLKLEEDPRHRDAKDRIGVRGFVSPAMAGQSVRVDLTSPSGGNRTASLSTGSGGEFAAVFDLTRPPDAEDDDGTRRLGLDPNVALRDRTRARLGRVSDALRERAVAYECQAHLIHASRLAPASSNVVQVSRRHLP